MKFLPFCLSLFILLSSTNCRGNSNTRIISEPKDTIMGQALGFEPEKVFVLSEDIDIDNKVCVLPKGVTIKSRGGVIKNGIIVGQNTKILYKEAVFDNITIKGTWIVPIIKTSLFKNLEYENSLKDVLSLTNPIIKNKVYINNGLYVVATNKNEDACLSLTNNTELFLDGTIKIVPNAFTDYDILRIEGENIVVNGKGTIIGDKFYHLAKDGEWGMGIRVQKSRNVYINGLTIKDCWGDCIYVGRGSENVRIEKCTLDNGRRQGISVTKANEVFIKDCIISNVGGTPPEYAIDVEPNPGESANNIVIENVKVDNCKGGFLVYGRGQSAKVGAVSIRNCIISNVEKNAICILTCDKALLNKCKIQKQKTPQVIRCEDVKSLELKNNSFSFNMLVSAKNMARKIIGNSPENPIVVLRCDSSVIRNNKEKE